MVAAKRMLTIEEAAWYIGRSKQYIYDSCCKGKLARYKQGVQLRFDKADLDAFMMQNRKASKEEIENKAATYCVTHRKSNSLKAEREA